jgi:hypothetical protein
MRTALKDIGSGYRHTFTGIFIRTGIKNGYKGILRTILLKDVKDSEGNVVTDHLWFNMTKVFQSANLSEGDIVQFNARVAQYEKGYKGYRDDVYCPIETDYKLSHPTKVKNLGRSEDYVFENETEYEVKQDG